MAHNISLKERLQESRIKILSHAFIITLPVFTIIFLILFDRYIAELRFSALSVAYFLMVFVFGIILHLARDLKRYITIIEKCIESNLNNMNTTGDNIRWKNYRKRHMYQEAIPAAFLLFTPFITIIHYFDFLHDYSREIYVMLFNVYLISAATRRARCFRKYLSDLAEMFVKNEGADISVEIEYKFKDYIFVLSLAALIVFMASYFIMPVKALYIELFTVTACVMTLLGKILIDSYRNFYIAIETIDEVNSKKLGD